MPERIEKRYFNTLITELYSIFSNSFFSLKKKTDKIDEVSKIWIHNKWKENENNNICESLREFRIWDISFEAQYMQS